MPRLDPLEIRDVVRREVANLLTLADLGNTARRLWQIVFSRTDTDQAEVYGPLGYAARPAARGAKAVVIRPGNGTVSIVTAFQDPEARELDLGDDERAVFNDAAEVVITAEGKVLVRSAGGSAGPLATVPDAESLDARISALESAYNTHTHSVAAAPGTTAPPVPQSSSSATISGTMTLRAE